MPLPLIYHDDDSPEFPADHRFPMDKFRLLRDHLVATGLTARQPNCCARSCARRHPGPGP